MIRIAPYVMSLLLAAGAVFAQQEQVGDNAAPRGPGSLVPEIDPVEERSILPDAPGWSPFYDVPLEPRSSRAIDPFDMQLDPLIVEGLPYERYFFPEDTPVVLDAFPGDDVLFPIEIEDDDRVVVEPITGNPFGFPQDEPIMIEALPETTMPPETPIMVDSLSFDGDNPPDDRVAQLLEAGASDEGAVAAQRPRVEAMLDEAGKQAMRDSYRAYYEYRLSGYEHRRAVFDWQLFSSKVIFVVVILLVLLGLYFSWLQFMAAHNAPAPTQEDTADAAPARRSGLQTTFEAGTGGVKVSSPVLGVIILVISLAFFYLYLTHVYPISEIS